jgi:hypothetical protein
MQFNSAVNAKHTISRPLLMIGPGARLRRPWHAMAAKAIRRSEIALACVAAIVSGIGALTSLDDSVIAAIVPAVQAPFLGSLTAEPAP